MRMFGPRRPGQRPRRYSASASVVAESLEARRLLAAGIALDLTYGASGHAVHDLASTGIVPDYALDAVMLPDEAVVVVGSSGGWAVTRYTPAGQLDGSFGSGGTARLAGGALAAGVARQDDGKLVVGGNASSTTAAVVRYLPDGSPDPSFGDGGVASGGFGQVHSLALLPDGKILAGGRGGADGWDAHATIWRFNPDGSPDTTFGTDGRLSYDQDVYSQSVDLHFTLPDGRFVAGTPDQGLTRFAADGSRQLVYGGDFVDVERQPDGKLVGVGRLNGFSVRVARFDEAGGLDASFGTGGEVALTVGVGNTGGAMARALSILPDGKILVGADSRHNNEPGPESYDDIVLTRLNPDGSLDAGFGVGGRHVQALTDGTYWGYQDSLRDLLLTPDARRLIVVGVTSVKAAEDAGNINGGENHSLSRYALDVPLVVDPGGPYGPVDEGSPFAVSGANSTYADGTVVRYEWDTGFAGRAFVPDAEGLTADVSLPDDEEDLAGNLILRVTTSEGLQALSQPALVDVRNVAPTIRAAVDGVAVYGFGTDVRLDIADPSEDTLTGSVLFGDGKGTGFATWNRAVSLTNTYAAPGTYTVQASVTDDDGGTGSGTDEVEVYQIGGQVLDMDAPRQGRLRPAWGPGVTVYLDLDRDGTPGPGEPGTVTGAAGVFGFGGLALGEYRVAVVPPTGSLPTGPDSGFTDVTLTATTGAKTALGLTRKSHIVAPVYLDADGDGARDPGEAPDPRWSQPQGVTLVAYLDLDGDAVRDSGEPTASTRDELPGRFVFRGVDPGTYDVRLWLPPASGYQQTSPANDGGLRVTVPAGGPHVVTAGGEFGVQSVLPAITGSIYDDVDGAPGRSTSGHDPWLARWTMYDDLDDDASFDAGEPTAVSDASGAFRFNNVATGTHRIRPLLPPGWSHTSNLGGSLTVGSGEQVYNAGSFGVRHETDHTLPTIDAVTRLPGADAQGRRRLVYRFSEPLGDTSVLALRISKLPGPAYVGDAAVVDYDPATYSVTFALPAGLAGGAYSALLVASSVTDAVGNPMRSDTTHAFTLDTSAPAVTGVFLSGSSWGNAYRTALAADGAGEAGFGYRIDPAEQARTLGWSNLDQVSIRFDEDVAVPSDALLVSGVNVASYGVASFAYDPATFTATWTLARTIPDDKVTLNLGSGVAVTDLAGNRLDGEWTNPVAPAPGADAFPSGDGAPGGEFLFNLRVLPGDVNRDGRVSLADVNSLKANFSQPASSLLFGDTDGDDMISIVDLNATKAHFGKTAPA